MNLAASVVLLQLFLSAAATVSSSVPTETVQLASAGDVVLLQCNTGGNARPVWTTWMRDGHVVASTNGGIPLDPSTRNPRLTIEPNGSLSISVVFTEDSGNFICNSTLPDNTVINAQVQLQVTSGPVSVSTTIYPAASLPNSTLVAKKGDTVFFRCAALAYPAQQLSLIFSGAFANDTILNSTALPMLDYSIPIIQPRSQGFYTCSSRNTVTNHRVDNRAELLVYYIPSTHPDCMFHEPNDTSSVRLNCSWFGAYPNPKLRWSERGDFQETDSLVLPLNRSMLRDGQTVTCTAQHKMLKQENERSCSLTLRAPNPQGQPLVTALEGTNVSLTCSETTSQPAAITNWRKGQNQTLIVSGPKYSLSVEGPTLMLTIVNISEDDERYYFCRSENALGVLELEVYVTVKSSSSAYTGVVIGVFIAALIVGCAFVVAKILYSRRHMICLGGGFMQAEDRGDVLDLVDSDDEHIFQDTVPQLPPLPNGRHTTLVQIHRIPSREDHEDTENAKSNPQPAEQKEKPTEEPSEEVEDLVSI